MKQVKIDREHAAYLLNGGRSFDYQFINGEARVLRDWDMMKEKIMEIWLEHLPGTRPWGWWRFESPERRECLNHNISDMPKWARYLFGCPTLWTRQQQRACGEDVPEYESEYNFLLRHNLLTDEERQLNPDDLRNNSSKSWRGHNIETITPILGKLKYEQ